MNGPSRPILRWHGGKWSLAALAGVSVSLQAESTAEPAGDAVHLHLIFEHCRGRTGDIRHPTDQSVLTDVKSDFVADPVADHHLEFAGGSQFFLQFRTAPSR